MVLFALDYWAQALPRRTSYSVGVVVQNVLGFIFLLATALLGVGEFVYTVGK